MGTGASRTLRPYGTPGRPLKDRIGQRSGHFQPAPSPRGLILPGGQRAARAVVCTDDPMRRRSASHTSEPRRPRPDAATAEAGVSARALLALFAYLRGEGHDAVEFLRGGGMEFGRLLDPTARISHRELFDFWRRAEAITREPDLGLRVAGSVEWPSVMSFTREHIHLQVFAASATLGEGLAGLARYVPLTYPRSRLTCEDDGGDLRLRHHVLGMSEVPRSFAEFMLGWIVGAARTFAAAPVHLREVRFAHAAPTSTAEHERAFGRVPVFAAGENALVFRGEDIATPLRSHDPEKLAEYLRRGDEELARAPSAVTFGDRVRDEIAAELGEDAPSSERVARALGVSVRTMARRLEEQGTSYGALLDAVRMDLARSYLVDAGRSSTEAAELLGFSEPGAFRRAFRRWFGLAPTAYVRAETKARLARGRLDAPTERGRVREGPAPPRSRR